MDDKQIIQLYFARSEDAIVQTALKYGKLCRYVAFRILENDSDAEEIVNDTYLKVWNTIPPNRPESLRSYLAMIAGQLALNRYYEQTRQKRGGTEIDAVLEELDGCLSNSAGDLADEFAMTDAINRFLALLDERTRNIFVRRYWYAAPVKEIAREYGIKISYVTVSLLRTRNKLKDYLHKEGFEI